jgi:multicomponent Na+:H+ antiporter subunit G
VSLVLEVVVGLLMLTGALFCFVAAIGLIRLPDVYTRMHAASKACALGSGLLILAVGLYAVDLGIATRAIAGFVFLLLTTPISAHLLARAAYFRGFEPCATTYRDELKGHYGMNRPHLTGQTEAERQQS